MFVGSCFPLCSLTFLNSFGMLVWTVFQMFQKNCRCAFVFTYFGDHIWSHSFVLQLLACQLKVQIYFNSYNTNLWTYFQNTLSTQTRFLFLNVIWKLFGLKYLWYLSYLKKTKFVFMCLKLSQFQDKTQVFIKLAQQTSYISTCVNNNIFQNPNAIKLIMCYEIE